MLIFEVSRASKLLLAVTVVSSCALARTIPAKGAEETIPNEITALIVGELRASVPVEQGIPTRKNIHVISDTSRVVRGLVYYWGSYEPPESGDLLYRVVVAHRESTSLVLRRASDWAAAAAGWRPIVAEDAITACQEIIHVTRERDFPLTAPLVYREPGSLRSMGVRNSEVLDSALTRPIVEQAGSAKWILNLWTIGPRAVSRFRCMLGFPDSSLTVLETRALPSPVPML